MYNSLILPYLTYCVEVWGNSYKSNTELIYKLQKKAIRFVHNVGYKEYTNPLFLKSHIIKFSELVKLKTAQIAYKARNNQLPENIQNMFSDRMGDTT